MLCSISCQVTLTTTGYKRLSLPPLLSFCFRYPSKLACMCSLNRVLGFSPCKVLPRLPTALQFTTNSCRFQSHASFFSFSPFVRQCFFLNAGSFYYLARKGFLWPKVFFEVLSFWHASFYSEELLCPRARPGCPDVQFGARTRQGKGEESPNFENCSTGLAARFTSLLKLLHIAF